MPQRFVIASDEDIVACLLRAALRKLFPDRKKTIITWVKSLQGIRRLRRVAGGPDWLLVSQNLPERGTKRVRVRLVRESSGSQAAHEWLKEERKARHIRRAILITDDPSWYPNPPPLQERLTALPWDRLAPPLSDLREIIHAGSAGVDYLPPTVIHLAIRQQGKGFRLAWEDPPFGPLSKCFDALRDAEAGVPQDFGGFRSTAHLWKHHGVPNPAALTKAINRFSTQATKNGPCLLRRIAAVAHDIAELLTGRACTTELGCPGPYPVHLHFHWKCQESLQPLDLVRLYQAGVDCVGTHFPVVWRVNSPHARGEDADGKHTDILYAPGHFHVLHSCCREFRFRRRTHDGLAMLPGHSLELLVAAAGPVKNAVSAQGPAKGMAGIPKLWPLPVEARAPADLCMLFVPAAPGPHPVAVHVTTHGWRGNPVQRSGLIVGPAHGKAKKNAVVVTAAHLAKHGQPNVRFAFFNACELGDQMTARQAASSFIGSFGEGVVAQGACSEAICNRWPVLVDSALPLATSFYATRPLTVHGRAAALLRAKRTVLGILDSAVKARATDLDSLSDLSWLAPMHVWWRDPSPDG